VNATGFAGGLPAAGEPRGPACAGPFSWARSFVARIGCGVGWLAFAAALTAQAATPSPAPPHEVRGQVVLPPEAEQLSGALLVIELREIGSDQVWAEQRLVLDRPGPTQPFRLSWRREALPFEPELRVRAALRDPGRMLWISEPKALNPRPRSVDLGKLTLLRAPPPLAFHTVIDCRVRRFVIGMDGDRLVLRDGETTYPLRHDAEPPGSRHLAIDDPSTFVQTEGTTADVSVRGVRYALCSLSR
jgi:uncharacterized lipoprotein YbaY